MGKVAFLFSGQGTQHTGMGKSLCESSLAAKKVFDLADSIRPGTSKQCFEASKDELSLTVNTQPCAYCVDLAAAEALREAGIVPDVAAGFSLGEIAALTFCGVFTPKDGFSFVCQRGKFMNDAAEKTGGGMAAVLKLPDSKVEEICSHYKYVYPVNYNSPGQVSVAGDKEELPALCSEVAAEGGRAVPLAVSGAFHSPFMREAGENLKRALAEYNVNAPAIPVYSDCMASLYPKDSVAICENIVKQVSHPVLWRKILENMRGNGIDTYIETGPGKVLSGLVHRTLSDVKIYHVEDAETLRKTVSAIKQGGAVDD
jgi:[acyl-carrier-protein] S-malonyltransferase